MFNAIKYTQELEKAGFSREQAELSVRLVIDTMNENFATKSDLKDVETSMCSELKAVEGTLRSEMRAVETSLRSEMKQIETSLRTEIRDLDSKLDRSVMKLESSIRELDYKLTIKLGTMMTVAIGLTATLMKMLQATH